MTQNEERMNALETRVNYLCDELAESIQMRLGRLEHAVKNAELRLDKAATVITKTLDQQNAFQGRMEEIVANLKKLVQNREQHEAVSGLHLQLLQQAMDQAEVTGTPIPPNVQRRMRLHTQFINEAEWSNLGIRELAAEFGIAHTTISRWIKGKIAPRSERHLDMIESWLLKRNALPSAPSIQNAPKANSETHQ